MKRDEGERERDTHTHTHLIILHDKIHLRSICLCLCVKMACVLSSFDVSFTLYGPNCVYNEIRIPYLVH